MARFSRVRGPASDVALGNSNGDISGMGVNRSFGDGSLLITGQMELNETNGVAGLVSFGFLIDGVILPFNQWSHNIAALANSVVPFSLFLGISRGFHSIQMQGFKNLASLVDVVALRTELIVIEFPEWDGDAFIVTL